MSLGITEIQLTDNNIISIPTDAIFILTLLIVFALLGYFFHNILNNQTNRFDKKVSNNSNFELIKEKLEDKLTIKSATVNHENKQKPNNKKLNFLQPSKFIRITSLALIAIGGSNLLRVQTIQNPSQEVNTSQVNIKTKNQSEKSLLSRAKTRSSNISQTTRKKISYIDPFLSTNNSAKNNYYYQVKIKQREDFFSF